MKRFLPVFGPLAGIIFFVSVYVLAIGVDGYSHVAQTISEIGKAGTGVAAFPSPHPLHNVFGLSLTIGYLAPLALAITWRDFAAASTVVRTSWIAFALIVLAIFLNLSPLFARDLYPLEYYGVVQRSLFVVFYGWCAYLGIKTWR